MFQAFKAWFTALSTLSRAGVVTSVVVAGSVANAAVNSTPSSSTSPQPAAKTAQPTKCIANISTETGIEEIPFDKTTVDDPLGAQGTSSVQTAGVNGEKTITYKVVTYTPAGCNQDEKTKIKEEVTKNPINEVTAVGTYVAPAPTCTNGSYTNSDGVTVCSPSSDPSGATAKCADGTYSYSLHRSGTCSHHGGVAVWY